MKHKTDIDRYISTVQRAMRLGWPERKGWGEFLNMAFNRILNPEEREI